MSSSAPGDFPSDYQTNKLFVGNIAFHTREERLCEVFGVYGNIVDCRVAVEGNGSERSKGYGFVTLDTSQGAIDALHGSDVDGRPIKVEHVTGKRKGGGVNVITMNAFAVTGGGMGSSSGGGRGREGGYLGGGGGGGGDRYRDKDTDKNNNHNNNNNHKKDNNTINNQRHHRNDSKDRNRNDKDKSSRDRDRSRSRDR